MPKIKTETGRLLYTSDQESELANKEKKGMKAVRIVFHDGILKYDTLSNLTAVEKEQVERRLLELRI